jgi:hypothetical protein
MEIVIIDEMTIARSNRVHMRRLAYISRSSTGVPGTSMRETFIAVAFLFVVLFSGAAAAQDEEDAKNHYEQAVALFNEGRYAEALVEFRASYEAFPIWKVRYYIGVTLKELNDFVGAQEELEAYLKEGGKSVPQGKRDEVKEILARLPEGIGAVDIVTDDEGASVYVGGNLAGETPLAKPVRKNAGTYQVEVKKEGFEDFVTTVNVQGGKQVSLKVKLEKKEGTAGGGKEEEPGTLHAGMHAKKGSGTSGASLMKISGGALLGLGAVGLLVGTATGGAAVAAGKDLDQKCPGGECDPAYRKDIDKMDALASSSDAFLCIGIAAAVAGVVLLVLDRKRESKPSSRVSVSPAGLSGLGLTLGY